MQSKILLCDEITRGERAGFVCLWGCFSSGAHQVLSFLDAMKHPSKDHSIFRAEIVSDH